MATLTDLMDYDNACNGLPARRSTAMLQTEAETFNHAAMDEG